MSLQHRVTRLDSARHKGQARALSSVNLIVLHGTASGKGSTARGVIKWMNSQPNPISYTYLIDRDGGIVRMTDPKFTAYHSGVSAWPYKPVGRESVNKRSIGIAFVTDEKLREPLTPVQLENAEWLCRVWMKQLNITAASVVSHREVSPGRKYDPVMLPMGAWRAQLSR